MSKRFTETDKWRDREFRSLTPGQKLVWLYIRDNCDMAGFFDIDLGLMAYLIGVDEDQVLGAVQGLNRAYSGAKDGDRIWLGEFIKEQKNFPLNEANNAHKSIIATLRDKGDAAQIRAYLGPNKAPGKGKGKGSGKGKGEDPLLEQIYDAYPKKGNRQRSLASIKKMGEKHGFDFLLQKVEEYKAVMVGAERFIAKSDSWFGDEKFLWKPEQWNSDYVAPAPKRVLKSSFLPGEKKYTEEQMRGEA